MRHFGFLSTAEHDRLFLHAPEPFTAPVGEQPLDLVATALGASLYSPATRPRLAAELARSGRSGVVSVVLCLEDAVPDDQVQAAEANLIEQLRAYAASGEDDLLIFVRVRSPEQIARIVTGLGSAARVIAGFVLPKFTDETGPAYLETVLGVSAGIGQRLLAMPVIESPEVAFAESRLPVLVATRALVDKYRDVVPAIRIGATDLSAPFGLRRPREMTIYDVRPVADVISAVVNVFARADTASGGYVVTGPVWEYFSGPERLFKTQLREGPFDEAEERGLRAQLLAADLDGLIREITLDRANGLTGKTVIHPSHVAVVHALSVVTHEEYHDALDIAGTRGGGGVRSSAYRNKMNESKPHSAWARRVLLRARAFGVAREDVSFVDLLGASLPS